MAAPTMQEKAVGRGRRSRLGEPRTQRGRLVAAVGAVAWEQGSGGLTVERICDQAGMSRRTFYDLFVNADDAVASAVEEAHEELWAEVEEQLRRTPAPDWPSAMSTVVVAFLGAIERRPAAGWLCVGEPAMALARAGAARQRLMSRLAAFIIDGTGGDTCAADDWERGQAAMGAAGALWELVRQHLSDRDSDHRVRELTGPAIFLTLVPYVGRGQAMRMARHPPLLTLEGPGPVSPDRGVATARLTELAQRTLVFLRDRPLASNAEIADGIGVVYASQISRHLHRLADEGLIVGSRVGRRNAWSLTKQGESVLADLTN